MLDVPALPDLGSEVQNLARHFTTLMTSVMGTFDSTVIQLARLAYVSVLLLGVLLYYSHAERRLGKDLIKGGVVLAFLSEFVFPSLSHV